MRKNCSSDREKLLKFEAAGQEFEKKLRSLVTCNLLLIPNKLHRTIRIQVGKNHWDLETCRKI